MTENKGNNIFNEDDRQYLSMLQCNIERMATNSANCKNWMLMIVSALMAVLGSIGTSRGLLFLGILPALLFWHLDAYYLCLERGMRNRGIAFTHMFKSNNLENYKDALFNFTPYMIEKKKLTAEERRIGLIATNDRFFSKSTFPFYGITILVITLISAISNWATIIEIICK